MNKQRDARGLTPMQRQFVSNFVLNGSNGTQAAIAAGYSEESAYQRAYELLKKPHVIAAIQEEALQYLARLGPGSLKTLEDLMDNATSESVRCRAAEVLADRAGVRVTPKVESHIRMSPQDILERFEKLKAQIEKIKAGKFEESETDPLEDDASSLEPEKPLH